MEESRSAVTVPPNGGRRIVEWTECECHHRWVIESPYGSTSKGVCQQCGAEREFANCIEYCLREEDLPVIETQDSEAILG